MKKLIWLFVWLTVPAYAHDHGGESKARVGADKGVLEADEDEGFVLRDSAEKNFAIKKQALAAGPQWQVPLSALVYSGLETQVFRQREGHWKSVDVEIIRKKSGTAEIRSKGLNGGDQLATEGTGFLKTIEQSVFGAVHDEH